jgi:hypothetical protein
MAIFLKPEFCERYWIPFFKDGTIVEGAIDPEEPSIWIRILSIFRLKHLLLAALVAIALIRAATNGPGNPASSLAIPDLDECTNLAKNEPSKRGSPNRDRAHEVLQILQRLPNAGSDEDAKNAQYLYDAGRPKEAIESAYRFKARACPAIRAPP